MSRGEGREKDHLGWNRLLLNHPRRLPKPRWLNHGPDNGRSTAWSMLPAIVDPAITRAFSNITVSITYGDPTYQRVALQVFALRRGR